MSPRVHVSPRLLRCVVKIALTQLWLIYVATITWDWKAERPVRTSCRVSALVYRHPEKTGLPQSSVVDSAPPLSPHKVVTDPP